MAKAYERAEMKVILLDAKDIISTSGIEGGSEPIILPSDVF